MSIMATRRVSSIQYGEPTVSLSDLKAQCARVPKSKCNQREVMLHVRANQQREREREGERKVNLPSISLTSRLEESASDEERSLRSDIPLLIFWHWVLNSSSYASRIDIIICCLDCLFFIRYAFSTRCINPYNSSSPSGVLFTAFKCVSTLFLPAFFTSYLKQLLPISQCNS